MTTDVRAAILARCGELERAVEAAGGEGASWHQPREFLGDLREGKTRPSHVVRDAADDVVAFAANADLATFIAAWSPSAVFDLTAGARQMVAIHPAHEGVNGDGDERTGCECGDADEFVYGTCPTLRATTFMLGAKVSGG